MMQPVRGAGPVLMRPSRERWSEVVNPDRGMVDALQFPAHADGQVAGAQQISARPRLHRQFNRLPAIPIQLVDESENGRMAQAAASISLIVRSSTPLAQSITISAESTAVQVR